MVGIGSITSSNQQASVKSMGDRADLQAELAQSKRPSPEQRDFLEARLKVEEQGSGGPKLDRSALQAAIAGIGREVGQG